MINHDSHTPEYHPLDLGGAAALPSIEQLTEAHVELGWCPADEPEAVGARTNALLKTMSVCTAGVTMVPSARLVPTKHFSLGHPGCHLSVGFQLIWGSASSTSSSLWPYPCLATVSPGQL